MAPLLGEVILGFIPGSDAIALFQAIGNEDVVGASIAMGGLVVDLAGLRAVRGAIRATRVFRKGLIIGRKLGRALSAAGKAARRGFKTVVENGQLVLRRGEQIIAKGDDAVRKFLEVTNIPWGSRPNPSTYLDAGYITNHLKKFEGGVTKFVSGNPTRAVGPPSGTFVLPKSQADDLIRKSGGDPKKLEDLLGLDRGTLGNNPVRIDTNDATGLRMPDGNELGANDKWIPGGETSGGILEATVDQIPLDKITVNPAF